MGGKKITTELPLGKTVEVRAVFRKAGELRYACAMDMIHGVFTLQ
jgi:plastocyanin domain-containing protein